MAASAKCVVRDPTARRDLGISRRIIGSAVGNIVKKVAYGNEVHGAHTKGMNALVSGGQPLFRVNSKV